MKKLVTILEGNMSGVLTGEFSTNTLLAIAAKAFNKHPTVANVTLGLSIGKEGLLEKSFKELEGTVDKELEKTLLLKLTKGKTVVLLYLHYSGQSKLFGTFTAVLKKKDAKK